MGYNFCSGEGTVPAVYVFGDSLADVGNNHYLATLLRADLPHNGIDYPGGRATGRFSNGKNAVDFLAERIGVPSPPPYLSISSSSNKTNKFLDGVNFASGGAGILNSTNKGQCLSFDKQIDYYSTVHGALVQQLGSAEAQNHLSKSVFSIIIGSNDIINYAKKNNSNKLNLTPQHFVDSLISLLRVQLKMIYNLGARKFVFIGAGPLGCCPSLRLLNHTRDCFVEANYLAALYNRGAASLLQELQSQLGDMSYSFFDTASAFLEYIQNPSAHGFSEVKAACCGSGVLNAQLACLPVSFYCSNRSDHLFWDYYHPTQTTADVIIRIALDGSQPYVYPINVRQLIAL